MTKSLPQDHSLRFEHVHKKGRLSVYISSVFGTVAHFVSKIQCHSSWHLVNEVQIVRHAWDRLLWATQRLCLIGRILA